MGATTRHRRSQSPPPLALLGHPHRAPRRRRARPLALATAVLLVAGGAGAIVSIGGSAAAREPRQPSVLALTAAQLGPGYTRHLITGGAEVAGQATLDMCGMQFPSEGLRRARVQDVYREPDQPWAISNEVVRYRHGGAQEALSEADYALSHCPGHPVPDPVAAADVLYRPSALSFPGLLPGASAWAIREQAAGRSATIVFVFQVRDDYLSGVYVTGDNLVAQEEIAVQAARASAHNLEARVPASTVPIPASPAHVPMLATASDIWAASRPQFIAACTANGDRQLPPSLDPGQLAAARRELVSICTCAYGRIEATIPIQEFAVPASAAFRRAEARAVAVVKGCLRARRPEPLPASHLLFS